MFFSSCYGHHRALHSFPTRRSSDLSTAGGGPVDGEAEIRVPSGDELELVVRGPELFAADRRVLASFASADRKSTRLNSSHPSISYAVFCLKKKTKWREPGNRTYFCR